MRNVLMLALLNATLIALYPGVADAFHAGALFDKKPLAGGGGGLFYTGSARDRGWTCAACHTDATRKMRVTVSSEPPELFTTGRYVPGQKFQISIEMDADRLGLGAGLSNVNSFAMTILQGDKSDAGSFSGTIGDFVTVGAAITSAGLKQAETRWQFNWVAPDDAVGPLFVNLAVMDGNGANSGPTETINDPFHDDLFLGAAMLSLASAAGPTDLPFATETKLSTIKWEPFNRRNALERDQFATAIVSPVVLGHGSNNGPSGLWSPWLCLLPALLLGGFAAQPVAAMRRCAERIRVLFFPPGYSFRR